MKSYLFTKDFWLLDLFVCLMMAIVVGYGFTIAMDDPAEDERLFLIRGTLAYPFAFVLGYAIHRFSGLSWVPSWVWLAIVGALIRILYLQTFSISALAHSHFEYSSSTVYAINRILYDISIITAIHWWLWAVTGLICVFFARAIVYLVYVVLTGKTDIAMPS